MTFVDLMMSVVGVVLLVAMAVICFLLAYETYRMDKFYKNFPLPSIFFVVLGLMSIFGIVMVMTDG